VPTLYNRIANQSMERLAALSDGLFAIAMTLLVLDLHVPVAEAVHSEHDLGRALLALAPRFGMYGMSFLTLSIFWNGQQTQLNFLARSNRDLTWIHLAFLCAISMMPFSTQLLAEFPAYRTALLVYWLNILLPGIALYASWRYASRAGLVKDDVPMEIRRAIRRRVVFAQGWYALGALLCFLSVRLSIGLIFLVQLNYVIAPRFLAPRGE
jgi:uncharacterized membrane protein